MTRKQSKQKILWAVDPFEEQGEARKHVLATLQDLSRQGAQIKPVYIFTPAEYGLSGLEVNTPWFKQNEPIVNKVLHKYIEDIQKDYPIENLKEAQVLIERRPSVKRAVQCLNLHGKQFGADMIAVGTHGRSGLSRFFLGSFSETLLLYSKLPVLVIGPHAETSKIQKIFLPTDFGKLSLSLFNKVLALAKSHKTSITLFNVVPRTAEPIIQSGVFLFSGTYLTWPEFVSKSEEKHRKTAARFVELGKKHGVEVSIVFDSHHSNISEAITEHAQSEKATLIAMGAESGLMASNLLGSVTRQVVRNAPCPVWVSRLAK